MRRPIKWGQVAGPEPRIVMLLRMLRSRDGLAPIKLKATFAELDKILEGWIKTENLEDLKAALGVAGKRGPGARRTQLKVNRDNAIVDAMYAAAWRGADLRTYGKAAKALRVDAKQISRAWQEWGEFRIHSMSVMARHCESRGYEFRHIVEAIGRLPQMDNK